MSKFLSFLVSHLSSKSLFEILDENRELSAEPYPLFLGFFWGFVASLVPVSALWLATESKAAISVASFAIIALSCHLTKDFSSLAVQEARRRKALLEA